ncbi:putative cardiolipin synthase [Cognatiyoonia sediminum]|uniref:Phospholipase D n=1 Tax=Cognatiyoonia sediminum TaxID=1508389 RepID=A0A1M5KZ33_9RHOB|nr:phospholipase D family protein [Cognatiyoonia sediminum]SHG58058.1 putative cardiolipin synthase [Cognatiyoonia sediminum]
MLKFLKNLLIIIILFVGASFIFQVIFPVPSNEGRENSTYIAASTDTQMGELILGMAEENPGTSGVLPLLGGPSAFAARVAMARAAEQSIDARYYIWQRDITGILLLDELKKAADRGVRVRFLLDDNGIPDLDPEFAELDAHPNIEVRVFNPFVLRSPRVLTYIFDFLRINRRMHNKSMTFDGVATIVGGRNIGDIYFDRNEEVNYFDFDVAVIGDGARDVDEDFDLYWASESAVPFSELSDPDDPATDTLAATYAEIENDPATDTYLQAIEESLIIPNLNNNAEVFEWVEVALVSDDPAKALGAMDPSGYMAVRLYEILPTPQSEIDLISAYFIPGDFLTDRLTGWAQDGLLVRTLTNAQEATDVLPVHGGYIGYREALVEGGVKVFELKTAQELRSLTEQFGLTGESRSSLHAKTFIIDREHIFVGSYNFDPRSARLNTEMGFLVASPSISTLVVEGLDENIANRAYEVVFAENGDLEWIDAGAEGGPKVWDTEPNTTWFSRFLASFIGILPIEWML